MANGWMFHMLAAGFEVLFAMAMKYAEGFTRLLPRALVVVAASAGIYCLTLALKDFEFAICRGSCGKIGYKRRLSACWNGDGNRVGAQ